MEKNTHYGEEHPSTSDYYDTPLAGYKQRSIDDISDYRERSFFNREKLFRLLFFTDTKEGWYHELVMLGIIFLSCSIVFIDSVFGYLSPCLGGIFRAIEWCITISVAVEYFLRVYASKNVHRYIFSFYGIVDLFSFLPTLLTVTVSGTHYVLIFRILRLLRIFRVFHMGEFVQEGRLVARALRQSYIKIVIFILWLTVIVCVLGTIMYLIEGDKNPMFSSIPRSIYWAIITLTTVGYGDITPITALGQFISTVVMLLGYSIIAVPTGIVTAEVSRETRGGEVYRKRLSLSELNKKSNREAHQVYCYLCGYQNIDPHAKYCCNCGTALHFSEEREGESEEESRGGEE